MKASEVIFVTSSKEDAAELDVIGADVRKRSGELRKLVLQQDATYDGTEYDCENCDGRPACDSVRDWIEPRRDKTAAAGASTG